jgi:intracellular sulfur oxidation DsrE/DsrF family protein
MNGEPSEERLNALIDGELAPADAEPLLEQLRTDAALRERVGQLRLGKELVRHAYAGLAAPHRAAPDTVDTPRRQVLAASVLAVAVGALLGWTAREQGLGPMRASVDLAGQAVVLPPGAAERIVLHLGTAAPQDALAVLERAEGILQAARATGRVVPVEIVANGGGLDLLRAGISAHAERIAGMRVAYPQLSLVACGQTAQRLRDGGVEVRLLPGTVEASSALDEIVLRMQQGWAYVRI